MTFVGHFDVELLINAMRILYKMYNKFSFYSIVVQTVAPEGSSATEVLKVKVMHVKIDILHVRIYILKYMHVRIELCT